MLKNKKNVTLLRKYSSDINWWVEQERYKNGKIVRILPGKIIQELLSIDERLSNGYTEGLNNKIKVIKRVGF